MSAPDAEIFAEKLHNAAKYLLDNDTDTGKSAGVLRTQKNLQRIILAFSAALISVFAATGHILLCMLVRVVHSYECGLSIEPTVAQFEIDEHLATLDLTNYIVHVKRDETPVTAKDNGIHLEYITIRTCEGRNFGVYEAKHTGGSAIVIVFKSPMKGWVYGAFITDTATCAKFMGNHPMSPHEYVVIMKTASLIPWTFENLGRIFAKAASDASIGAGPSAGGASAVASDDSAPDTHGAPVPPTA